jgi:hypothetical protein
MLPRSGMNISVRVKLKANKREKITNSLDLAQKRSTKLTPSKCGHNPESVQHNSILKQISL